MNGFPSEAVVKSLRERYPKGTRVSLVNMNDSYSKLNPSDKGTVSHVDDAGTIHVRWDCGSGLGIVYGEDSCRKLTEAELAAEQQDEKYYYTLFIRRYGRSLQFDSLDKLKDELKRYFSPKELSGGIVERLIDFKNKNEDGYFRNSYQDFEVCCYEKELNVSSQKMSLDSQIQSATGRSAEGQVAGKEKTSDLEL